MTKNVRFAFIQKETARLLGSPRKFTKHGQCGMELSDFLPHLATCADDIALIRSMHTEAFNHHPGQLADEHRRADVRPAEHGVVAELRPRQRVEEPARLRRADRRPRHQRRRVELVERLSAVDLPGRPLPQPGRAGPEPEQPGRPDATSMQAKTIDALRDLNRQRHAGDRRPGDQQPHRRVRTGLPHAVGRPGADRPVRARRRRRSTMYGVGRDDRRSRRRRGGGKGQFNAFATNCLLARRLVERGVRFVNLYHASWDHHSNLDEELALQLPAWPTSRSRRCSRT